MLDIKVTFKLSNMTSFQKCKKVPSFLITGLNTGRAFSS